MNEHKPWIIIEGLQDTTSFQTGDNNLNNQSNFDAIEIKTNGIYPNGGGPTILVEDWKAPGYDEDENRVSEPSDEAKKLAHHIVRAVNRDHVFEQLVAALEVMIEHAGETYPHFESPRGQEDISRARKAIESAKQ